MTLEERRERVAEILESLWEVEYKCALHSACVIWISPFNTVEWRVGYFPERTDAYLYACSLYKTYKHSGLGYCVYIDRQMQDDRDLR